MKIWRSEVNGSGGKFVRRTEPGAHALARQIAIPLAYQLASMKRYLHRGGESGVAAYETGPRSITIRFRDGGIYRYTYAKTGARRVEAMKELASEGKGLATYINQHVRGEYATRLG